MTQEKLNLEKIGEPKGKLIDTIYKNFCALANLQSCENTEKFINYNIVSVQIIKIKRNIDSDEPTVILPKIESLRARFLEMSTELPAMIDNKDLEKATHLYKQIQTDIESLKSSVETLVKETESEASPRI